ncbi:MAG: GNAT family N-acetyltransferase [Anaerolineae bacterium]
MKTLSAATLLITGIMASGKSTVAQQIAERIPNSVHLRGDWFRRMIINGRAEIDSPLSDQALLQLRMRYQLAAQAAHIYCQNDFTVIYQDVVLGSFLTEVVQQLSAHPLYVVVLCPRPEVALQRDGERSKHAYRGWTPEALDHELRTHTPRIGLWVDSSAQTPAETTDYILANLPKAWIAPVELNPVKLTAPTDLEPLLQTSLDEGYTFLQRLWDEYQSGLSRFDDSGAALIGVYDTQQLIAIGGIHRDPYLNQPEIGRIQHVYVLPAYRRTGIGRRLVAALIAQARAQFTVLTLRTLTSHGDAFYQSLGFSAEPPYADATHWMRL